MYVNDPRIVKSNLFAVLVMLITVAGVNGHLDLIFTFQRMHLPLIHVTFRLVMSKPVTPPKTATKASQKPGTHIDLCISKQTKTLGSTDLQNFLQSDADSSETNKY